MNHGFTFDSEGDVWEYDGPCLAYDITAAGTGRHVSTIMVNTPEGFVWADLQTQAVVIPELLHQWDDLRWPTFPPRLPQPAYKDWTK